MKKGVVVFALFCLLALSVHAVTYGERIQRFQEFPSEVAQRELPPPPVLTEIKQLEDVQENINTLNDQISALRTAINNARSEQNVQVNSLLAEVGSLKDEVGSVEDLKILRDELPAIVDKPRPAPLYLTLLTIVNFLLLCIMLALGYHIHSTHTTTALSKKGHSHKELFDYIRKSLRGGMHIRIIRHNLIEHGWDEEEIDKAFHQIREGEM